MKNIPVKQILLMVYYKEKCSYQVLKMKIFTKRHCTLILNKTDAKAKHKLEKTITIKRNANQTYPVTLKYQKHHFTVKFLFTV